METTKVSQFYQNVSSAPRSQGELLSVADRILSALEVSFAALFLSDPVEQMSFKLADRISTERIDEGVFDDFLKKQVQHAEELRSSSSGAAAGGHLVTQIQLNREKAPWESLADSSLLSIVRITPFVATRAGAGHSSLYSSYDLKVRKDLGWIAIGSSKPLTARQEVLLIAMAQHLAELILVSKLEDALQLRSQFLSIASHELKTPLTSIYGVLQLQERMLRLKKDETPQAQLERQHHFLKMVIRQVERLNELIDGLLDVSRIQSGRFMVEPTDSDVAVILQDTVSARLNIIAEEAGVKLHLDTPPSLSAWVDPVRMEEVITNLIMNAIRFSPEGGVVWIKLRDEDESFRLTIRDQGPSVPSEDRERIFHPFERAHRTSRLGGLGLGLFISRQIAQLHGGNVSLVESVPGKGNVFEAHFPTRNISLVSVSA